MRAGLIGFCVGAFALVASTATAFAVPSFTNNNFIGSFPAAPHYGVPPGWTASGFASGSTPYDTSGFWDNGVAPNGVTQVGFLQNFTSLTQTIVGLTVGDTYVISVAASSRTPSTSVLGILVDGVAAAMMNVAPVDPAGVQVSPFAGYSASFVAVNPFAVLGFSNNANSTVLLSDAEIADVTVPEPLSLSLLSMGLVGVGLMRRKSLSASQS